MELTGGFGTNSCGPAARAHVANRLGLGSSDADRCGSPEAATPQTIQRGGCPRRGPLDAVAMNYCGETELAAQAPPAGNAGDPVA
eukprot:scaffold624_cov402-Prasinococcus_capsulatus_cf.AAC.83